jgi:hypothetical protein
MDKAKRRLEAETCVRIMKHQHLGQVEIAHFVVVRSLGMIIPFKYSVPYLFTFLFFKGPKVNALL